VVGPDNTVHLWSSEQNLIESVPHINEALEELCLPMGLELDGELYIHQEEFGDLHSIISQKNSLAEDYERMEYHVFDLIDETMTQLERAVHLSRIRFHPPIFAVKNTMVNTIDEVLHWVENFTDHGYEGIILRELSATYMRKRSSAVMKYKPKKDDYYTIVGVNQLIDKFGHLKPLLGSFTCIGNDGTPFNVGSGFTEEQRREFWLNPPIGQLAHVQYQNINPSGALRFPVFLSVTGDSL
jgi:DNA ligase-1